MVGLINLYGFGLLGIDIQCQKYMQKLFFGQQEAYFMVQKY